MTDEAKKARAEYKKAWRKAHPEKEKEYHERYWEKKAKQLREATCADNK